MADGATGPGGPPAAGPGAGALKGGQGGAPVVLTPVTPVQPQPQPQPQPPQQQSPPPPQPPQPPRPPRRLNPRTQQGQGQQGQGQQGQAVTHIQVEDSDTSNMLVVFSVVLGSAMVIGVIIALLGYAS